MSNSGSLKLTTPTDREVVMTRVFDAPRRLVFEAMAKPELLQRWLLGPAGWSMVVCENDLRVGGAFRWVWRGPDGAEMAMRGVCREVVPPERIVRTESFEFGCDAQGASNWRRSSSPNRGLRPRSRSRCSTRRRRPATRPSPPAWNVAWPRATTGLPGCWSRPRDSDRRAHPAIDDVLTSRPGRPSESGPRCGMPRRRSERQRSRRSLMCGD